MYVTAFVAFPFTLHVACCVVYEVMILFSLFQFFNQVLVMGKSSVSDLSEHVFDLIQELFAIDPMLLTSVMPQLEFKLKVNTKLIFNPQAMDDVPEGPRTKCLTSVYTKLLCFNNSL